MSLIEIETKPATNSGLPILRLGFRPFFLLAGISAVISILFWLKLLNGGSATSGYVSSNWHAHEMLFGFTVAVVTGFLLTAEKNWTNIQTLHGARLGFFALLWLAGRIAPWLPIPAWLIAVIDLSFLPLLAVVLLRPLLKTSQYQHLVFIIIVLVLFLANLLYHLGQLQPAWHTMAIGIRLAWLSIIFLISVMGGRVIPFFIERGTGAQAKVRQSRSINIAASLAILVWMLGVLLAPTNTLIAYLALVAGALQSWRWFGWHLSALWRVPMLWILYLGYGWVPVGLFLYAYSVLTTTTVLPALHAFTAGTIGMLTLGMMARVSLGHTGRTIETTPLLTIGFIAITLGALVRVFGPLLAKPLALNYVVTITSAGILWACGFLIFVILYTPILIRPRADGRSG